MGQRRKDFGSDSIWDKYIKISHSHILIDYYRFVYHHVDPNVVTW